MSSDFTSLELNPALLATLTKLGYEKATPIQREAIPPLLAGKDVLGQAATGTGKTAAFTLPLLQRITRDRQTRALVLVPTRELAIQVSKAVYNYGAGMKTSVQPVYGGASMRDQVRGLKDGVNVVVATPGRATDLVNRGILRLDGIEVLVLDEADQMLDMGFAEDLEKLLAATPKTRQTALFSATLPPRIVTIAKKYMNEPVRITVLSEQPAAGEAAKVSQRAYIVSRGQKGAALERLLAMEEPQAVLVFCRMRTDVDNLTESLKHRGYAAEPLHGGLSQEQRDRVMRRFRSGETKILVATDVAARGLDINHLSHVINFDVPEAREDYVHRIGRTGRAGREGVAITFLEPMQRHFVKGIEALTKQTLQVLQLPSVTELRKKKLEALSNSIKETLANRGLEKVHELVLALSQEYDVAAIAAAAIMQLHEAQSRPNYEIEIALPARPKFNDRPRHAQQQHNDRPKFPPRREQQHRGRQSAHPAH